MYSRMNRSFFRDGDTVQGSAVNLTTFENGSEMERNIVQTSIPPSDGVNLEMHLLEGRSP